MMVVGVWNVSEGARGRIYIQFMFKTLLFLFIKVNITGLWMASPVSF